MEECQGKEAFTDYHLAERAAQRLRRRNHAITVYKCHSCSHWHVGGSGHKHVGKRLKRRR